MRTEIEALKEIHDRISYFCSRTDGKYDPPWAQEVIGIIDDVLTTPLNQEAHRRELSKNVSKNGADFGQLGDAAKLREALGKLRAELWNNTVIAGKRKFELYEIADAALAAPPRNCDKYATLDDARKAHEEYRGDYIMRASNKFDFPMKFEAWLFAPATEQEGGAK